MKTILILSAMMFASLTVHAAKPMECVAQDGARYIRLIETTKNDVTMDLGQGNDRIACRFRRTTNEWVKNVKAPVTKSLRLHYKRVGDCVPKPVGKAKHPQNVFMVFSWQGEQLTAQIENSRRDTGVTCKLENFDLKTLGIQEPKKIEEKQKKTK